MFNYNTGQKLKDLEEKVSNLVSLRDRIKKIVEKEPYMMEFDKFKRTIDSVDNVTSTAVHILEKVKRLDEGMKEIDSMYENLQMEINYMDNLIQEL